MREYNIGDKFNYIGMSNEEYADIVKWCDKNNACINLQDYTEGMTERIGIIESTYNPTLEIEVQIQSYKRKLFDTDYKAIKYAEGELTETEYAPIKEQRRQWRTRINELEQQLT